jgi:hypothetical protein
VTFFIEFLASQWLGSRKKDMFVLLVMRKSAISSGRFEHPALGHPSEIRNQVFQSQTLKDSMDTNLYYSLAFSQYCHVVHQVPRSLSAIPWPDRYQVVYSAFRHSSAPAWYTLVLPKLPFVDRNYPDNLQAQVSPSVILFWIRYAKQQRRLCKSGVISIFPTGRESCAIQNSFQ